MKITICDDSVKDLIKIEELLFQYQNPMQEQDLK